MLTNAVTRHWQLPWPVACAGFGSIAKRRWLVLSMERKVGKPPPSQMKSMGSVIHWLIQIVALVIIVGPQVSSGSTKASSTSILFPKLRCISAFLRLGFDINSFDKYPTYFRSDSIVQLAQAGEYQGPKAIEEYLKFAFPGYSPYLLNISSPVARRNRKSRVLGYRNGQCEFLHIVKPVAPLNVSNTENVQPFNYVTMIKLFLDFEKGYVSRMNVFFTPDFLRIVFNVALNSPNTRRFLCKEVMSGTCARLLNETNTAGSQCEATQQALPTTEGQLRYFDGNSSGCRALHGVLALDDPTEHCPHLSFVPITDPLGRIKCQASKRTLPTDLFSESDLQDFRTFARRRGIDPEIGHDCAL
jgi:hypothetical protein